MSIVIEDPDSARSAFARAIARVDPRATRAVRVDALMLNVGLRCDLACAHCHQSSSPSRSEAMSRDTMLDALRLADLLGPSLIDVTGGEPTLWPHLPELVESAAAAGFAVRVRTNLVALARDDTAELPALFARLGVSLFGSLPGTLAGDVAEQRGPVFDRSLGVLRRLAELGYGDGASGLTLDLVVNPPLGELPRRESDLAEEFRATLEPLGVRFDALRVIANVPAGRFAERLLAGNEYDAYLDWLEDAFNPAVIGEIACRRSVEVAWDGSLSDCDFNLGAGMRVVAGPRTVAEALESATDDDGAAAAERGDAARRVVDAIATRRIAFGPHCFACAVGAGSS